MSGNWLGAFKTFDISGLVARIKKMACVVKEKKKKVETQSKVQFKFIKDLSS